MKSSRQTEQEEDLDFLPPYTERNIDGKKTGTLPKITSHDTMSGGARAVKKGGTGVLPKIPKSATGVLPTLDHMEGQVPSRVRTIDHSFGTEVPAVPSSVTDEISSTDINHLFQPTDNGKFPISPKEELELFGSYEEIENLFQPADNQFLYHSQGSTSKRLDRAVPEIPQKELQNLFSTDLNTSSETVPLPKLSQTGTLPKLSQTETLPKLSQTGTLPKLSQTGTLPNLSQTGTLPKLSQTGTLPKLNENLDVFGSSPDPTPPTSTPVPPQNVKKTGGARAIPKSATGVLPKIPKSATGVLPKLTETTEVSSSVEFSEELNLFTPYEEEVPKSPLPPYQEVETERVQRDFMAPPKLDLFPDMNDPELDAIEVKKLLEPYQSEENKGGEPPIKRPEEVQKKGSGGARVIPKSGTGVLPKISEFASGVLPKIPLPENKTESPLPSNTPPKKTKKASSGGARVVKKGETGVLPKVIPLHESELKEETELDDEEWNDEQGGTEVTEQNQRNVTRIASPRQEEKKKKAGFLPWILGGAASLFVLGGAYIGYSVVREAAELEKKPVPDVSHVMPDEGAYITYAGVKYPVHEDVPMNSYDGRGFFFDENNYMRYEMEGTSAIAGIDVSYHQKEIDWKQVAEAGFEFAMIRVGRRGYGTDGIVGADTDYVQNITGALENNMNVGVYFFSQAVNMEEVRDEVHFVLDLIQEFDITYPVVFDWEFIGEDIARTDDITGAEITEMAAYFCSEVEKAGYIPMVYFNLDMAYRFLDLSAVVEYPFWLAELSPIPRFYYHFDMLQYSFTGEVPGIVGDVDLNLSFRDFATESRILTEEKGE